MDADRSYGPSSKRRETAVIGSEVSSSNLLNNIDAHDSANNSSVYMSSTVPTRHVKPLELVLCEWPTASVFLTSR